MDRAKAIEKVGWLTGLFPTLTTDQGREWRDIFENYSVAAIDAAVKKYHESEQGAFVRGGALMSLIRQERRLELEKEGGSIVEREVEREKINASWKEIDALINAIDDASLETLRQAALNEFSGVTREFLERVPVRKSATLKGKIYQIISRDGVIA